MISAMKKLLAIALPVILALTFSPQLTYGQITAINIAQGKKIEATSTCGVGVGEEELFCKLATVPGKFAISGLSCDYCDPKTPSSNHSIEYAIDGTEHWWQSPPLSRGLQYQQVNITIDLGQEYQVAYVIVKAGNAPRPGTWALEKSIDGGKTFTPWQYFATTNSECLKFFGTSSLLQSFKDDTTVTCTTSYSQVPPFENGEIHISLVNGRPGAANFSYSRALQDWTRATHIRLRLLKVKTLLADLLPLAREDPTVTRRYFYSIKDISVGGICMCNGHADECVQPIQQSNSQLVCRCKHATCGIKCETCCPGFVQKPWRPATPDNDNECEPCNCHNHATDCYYSEQVAQEKRSLDINGNYEGGGVCRNCQHNTYGINCERCKPGYYRPTGVPKTSADVCQACVCDLRFSTGRCFDGEGNCECLENYSGSQCNQCNEGYYGFPNCKPCDCHPLGTSGRVCGPTGEQCPCKPGYTGAKCDQCDAGYYGFPNCRRCNCDRVGSISPDTCDSTTGQCNCRQMYTSRQCTQCSKGFYSFPECNVCNCDAEGTARDICDPNTGECICMKNFAGPRCDVCNEGYHRFPSCVDCGCSEQGSVSRNCSRFGVCKCRVNYEGVRCDRCRAGYYSYPQCVNCSCDSFGSQHQFCDPRTGQCLCKGSFRGQNCNLCRSGYYGFPNCRACECNPAGIKPLPDRPLGDCSSSNMGQCDCKDNVQGLICSECKDGYYALQSSNPMGCKNCDCNLDGVIGGLRTCDKTTGQCPCKLYVTGRRCTRCKVGFYGLAGRKVFGCTGCGCDVGGAYDQYCDSSSGQCSCRPNVVGRDCSSPAPQHYYPTLLQIKSEMEDGTTVPSKQGSDVLSPDIMMNSDGQPVRFGFDESVFPGYSWRGYAAMSDIQRVLKVTVDIPKTGRYHTVFRYILNESSPVTGEVMFTPKGGVGSKQSSKVTFPVTPAGPTHQTVGEADSPTQFMLTKGQWDLVLVLPPASVLLDYVVTLPREYYEAYLLEEKVTKPCQVNGYDSLCNQFSFLSTNKPGLFTTELETGYIIKRGTGREDTQLFKNESVLQQLDFSAMALLDSNQNRVTADLSIPDIGKYVLVLQYFHPAEDKTRISVYLRYRGGTQNGFFNLQSCNFRFGCRQVAVDQAGAVKVFDVLQIQKMVVTLLSRSDSPISVDSIIAIPLDMWTLDFIAPNILCTTKGGVCIATSYPVPKGAVKIEVDGDDPSEQQPPNKQDPATKLQYLEGPEVFAVSGTVPRPRKYAAIVHYYQPKHSSFDAKVSITSDRALDGTVKFHYCPHASGCRSVIRDINSENIFDIGRTSVGLEFNIPANASTWIDYVLLIPEDSFTEELQQDAPVPLTQEFLDTCSKDHFFIKSSDPQFCKDSVFSLTTSFNNGSFPCGCHPRGAYNNVCDKFGGQCLCRPNVIGRTCSRCKTGYYGFPNCRKCRCVFCNEVTGACDCPKNTVGPNCESCLQGTYGYDPILGCQDCECERFGVADGQLTCDAKTGQCRCKPSHTGRQCNKCAKGYYNYPLCQKCDLCDARGVDERICDGVTGQCFCKPGVVGERCDKCAAGYFNLDANNPNGCTECWCNGLSDTCFSSNKFWSKLVNMSDWTLENTPASVQKLGNTNLYASISSQRNDKGKPVYWVAPKDYLGKKITSYGGKLTYTVGYEIPQGSSLPVLTTKPDIVIEGKNKKVLQYKKQLELSPGVTSSIEAQFLENLWEDASGSNVTRDDFMSVLLDIKSLKLRATYSAEVAEATLNDVVMNVAVDEPVEGVARTRSVEICNCPERATGSSCELCGKGYTRGVDNSSCIPCNCFGHSSECHDETGECISCQHNTTGRNCEVCEPGFFGDATGGSPLDCSICECPLGTTSNSFASSCSLDPLNQLLCSCREGYTGRTCERCADGFYGDPTQPGDYCKRCTCSGNLDSSVNGSCDTLTGQCLKCTNAATGDDCNRCLTGYYGNSVVSKNCARCACSDCGTVTAVCNHTSGFCQCKPNVIGDHCDSCKPNTWNFDSCLGCEDCDCSAASLSESCDVKTGQCQCPDGVTGRRCDRCKAGYFNYSDDGCTPCNCEKGQGSENLYGFCDVNTGQCCKEGGNCTICPPNYILTPEGCEYCGECVGRLLKIATALDRNLTLAMKLLQQGSAGIIAQGRFSDINETLQRLIPPTNLYNETMEVVSQIVGISSANESDVVQGSLMDRTQRYETTTEEVENKVKEVAVKATKAMSNATYTKEEALALEKEIRDALNRTRDIVNFAKEIAATLKSDKANQTRLLERAEEILTELNYTTTNETLVEEQELAMSSLSQAKTLLNNTLRLWNDLNQANRTLDELLGMFGAILDKTGGVLENASLAMDTNKKSRGYDSETPLTEAMTKKEDVDSSLIDLQDEIDSASSKLINASNNFQSFNESFPQLDDLIDQVNKRIANLSQALDELTPSVNMANNYSEQLRKQADDLEDLLKDIEFARKAVNASKRYSDIVNALNESLAIAQEAEEIAMDAKDKAQNVSGQAVKSQNTSSILKETASKTEDKVDDELSNLLDDIKKRLELIRAKIRNVSNDLAGVQGNFLEFDDMAGRIGNRGSELKDNATESKNSADTSRKTAEEIEEKLTGLSDLKKSVVETNNNITDTEEEVRNAINMTKSIKDNVKIVEIRYERIIEELDVEVKRRLDDIEGMLSLANTLLRSTLLVMRFDGNTTNEPEPPPAILKETRNLNIGLYTKPEKPDGLLLYMGGADDAGTNNRQKRQSACESDFIAVELEAKQPHLKICTSGKFNDFKDGEKIIDTSGNLWYKVEAGITGDYAKLSMRYYDKGQQVDAVSISRPLYLENPKIAFNDESKLIVGGVSTMMELPPEVTTTNYTGCVDGLEINNHIVGSWNSNFSQTAQTGKTDSGETNTNDEHCPSREGVTQFAATTEDTEKQRKTFFGTGYLKSGSYLGSTDPMGTVDFKFTTTSSNGLLVIAIDKANPSWFQAMELSNGYFIFKYNMEHGYKEVRSANQYDIGEEVTVKKSLNGIQGFRYTLTIKSKINTETLAENTFYYPIERRFRFLETEYIYWAGVENRTTIPQNVTSSFYKGCMSDMILSSGNIAVKPSPGSIFGCHVKPAWNVTFLSNSSFLQKNPIEKNPRGFDIGLSFQVPPTTQNGLLLLESAAGDAYAFVLGLIDGKVVLEVNTNDKPLALQTDITYNDGKWHNVYLAKDGAKMNLFVDEEVKSGKPGQFIPKAEMMYLGGIPAGFELIQPDGFNPDILNSLKGGSIKYLTSKGKVFNFAENVKRESVIFDGDDYSEPIPRDLFILKPTTTPPPVDNLDSSTTSPTQITPSETTKPPSTTEDSTTLPPTTTSEPVTTSAPTTTPEPTTTPPPTTTSDPTTTPPPTTTPEPTTTPPPTTTPKPTTTPPPKTTPEPTTTPPPTTTPEPTTTPPPTTTPEPTTTPSPKTTSKPTTTPAPTTTSEPMTTPLPTCPMPDDPAELEDVLGFGLDLNSYALYKIKRHTTLFKLISAKTELKFSFRASNPNGIMLYTANEPSQTDFIECHLEGSKVACSFNAGGGTLKLITPEATYSDGTWHTVWLSREKVDGTLYVDGIAVDSGRATGGPTYINSLDRFFLGGVPLLFDAKRVPAGSRNSFPGCITNVTVEDKKIDTPLTELFKAQNCYRDSPESGVSFKNGGGYLKVANKYSVGQRQEISLEIKPTSHTGLLLSSWNAKGDYIVLEMSNGNIIFRAENGGGQLVAEHKVDDPLQFCDGEWHKIQLWKINNIVQIQVDENPTYDSERLGVQTSADIYDPLYVGGLPVNEAAKGVTVTEGYTGCVRNLISKKPGGEPQTLYLANPLMMGGNLYLGGCAYK